MGIFTFLLGVLVLNGGDSSVGEQHRLIARPGAELRDAAGRPEMRVTIWYPAAPGGTITSIDIGPPGDPLFELGSVAMDAPFRDDRKHPLILLSHGFGGSARIMAWFGTAMAERDYVVVAVDHPGNNSIDEMTVPGAVLWWERTEDLEIALAAVLDDPVLRGHVDPDRIGAAGFSIGGLTALIAGGARASPEAMESFCRQQPADGACQPQIEFPVSQAEWRRALGSDALERLTVAARDDHSIAGVRAVFTIAPMVRGTDPASLGVMNIPVLMIAGSEDVTVPTRTHARFAESLIPAADLEIVSGATHYSFLAECTASGRDRVPACMTAAEQGQAHERAIAAAAALFHRWLQ